MRPVPLIAGVCLALATPLFAQNALVLTSDDIAEEERLADTFVDDGFGSTGENLSPAFARGDAPDGTESFAFTVFEPDAPRAGGRTHRYEFTIYALDVPSLGLDRSTRPSDVQAAIEAHVLGSARIAAEYGR